MTPLRQAIHLIRQARTIVVACHINPDGDCIGSLLSLGAGLERLGKNVILLSADAFPRKYRSLPGARRVVRKSDVKADLAIAVDCNTSEMLGRSFAAFERAKRILEIDHHSFRKPFGHTSLVDVKAAAVGEIVYRLLRRMGIEITADIAQNILTSLIVETNSFRLPNTRALTFRICARLLAQSVNYLKLTELVYWSRDKGTALLTGVCLARCRFLQGDRIAWSLIRRKDFRAMKGIDADVDAVADEMRAIRGVRIAVFFREKNERLLRVSLRSKGDINVALLAAEFGGGGHSDSAGCFIANKAQTMKKFLKRAEEVLLKRQDGD